MSPFIISLFVGIPVGVLVYSKSMQQTGNNTKSSLIAASVVGFVAFVVAITGLSVVDSYLEQ